MPNGGQTWTIGSQYLVRWDKGTGIDYVDLFLYKSGSYVGTLAKRFANSGGAYWTVPGVDAWGYALEGSGYKIKICDISWLYKPWLEHLCDESDNSFTIKDWLPSGDYNYLCKHNRCSERSYRTARWASTSINVEGVSGVLRDAVNRWPSVSFNHGSSGGISIALGYLSPGTCGLASSLTNQSSGEIVDCDITINANFYSDSFCKNENLATVVTHEVGHCLGHFKHSTNGGLMDAGSNASDNITTSANMINLLYSIPAGTNIARKLTSGYAKARTQKRRKLGKKSDRTWGAKTGHRLSKRKLPAPQKMRAGPDKLIRYTMRN